MKSYSLATIGSFLGAGALAVGMAAHALVEVALSPGVSGAQLVREHAAHIVLLYIPIWVALTLGFRAVFLKPLRKLESELYRIATRHPGSVDLETRVAELQSVERAANLMIQRMGLDSPGPDREAQRPEAPTHGLSPTPAS